MVYTVDAVDTVNSVHTVDTSYTIHAFEIALHCLNSSMCAYILLMKVRTLLEGASEQSAKCVIVLLRWMEWIPLLGTFS